MSSDPNLKGKKPTHKVFVKSKAGPERGEVGVGWIDPYGTISINLSAGVTLAWNDGLYIRVKPVEAGGDP